MPTVPSPAPAHVPNPWSELLLPAVSGGPPEGGRVAARLRGHRIEGADGATLSVLARALAASGAFDAVPPVLRSAVATGAPEALALASTLHPQGARLHRVALDAAPCGALSADVRCDLVAQAASRGRTSEAEAHLSDALAGCPGHAEALRWQRFLAEAGPDAAHLLSAPAARPGPLQGDVRALRPQARLGWFSPERWLRRMSSGFLTAPGPRGSALRRLQGCGVVSRVLGTDADHARRGAHHPLGAAEQALDHAESLGSEGRSAGAAAAAAWAAAAHVDPIAQQDLAGALAALGVRCPDAAPMGLVAIDLLQLHAPAVPLWAAYRVRLLAHIGDRAATIVEAEHVLRARHLDPVGFSLCIDALRDIGEEPRALRRTRYLARRPGLAAVAAQLLSDWGTGRRLLPMASDRAAPRPAPPEAAPDILRPMGYGPGQEQTPCATPMTPGP